MWCVLQHGGFGGMDSASQVEENRAVGHCQCERMRFSLPLINTWLHDLTLPPLPNPTLFSTYSFCPCVIQRGLPEYVKGSVDRWWSNHTLVSSGNPDWHSTAPLVVVPPISLAAPALSHTTEVNGHANGAASPSLSVRPTRSDIAAVAAGWTGSTPSPAPTPWLKPTSIASWIACNVWPRTSRARLRGRPWEARKADSAVWRRTRAAAVHKNTTCFMQLRTLGRGWRMGITGRG
jgi:hypothetical protein